MVFFLRFAGRSRQVFVFVSCGTVTTWESAGGDVSGATTEKSSCHGVHHEENLRLTLIRYGVPSMLPRKAQPKALTRV